MVQINVWGQEVIADCINGISKKCFRKWTILGGKIFGYSPNSRKMFSKVFLSDKKGRTVMNPLSYLIKGGRPQIS